MTNEKITQLYKKSQEIIFMMSRVGIEKYYNYSVKYTALGNFLVLDKIPITPYLIDTYIDNDLNKFIPKTSFDILERFNIDVENLFFKELEETYLQFIYEKSWFFINSFYIS